MAYDEQMIRDVLIRENRRKRRLRFVILVAFGMLGSMMSAVLLSHPAVSTQLQLIATDMGDRVSGQSNAASEVDAAPAPETNTLPQVRTMPTSHVPVRRSAGEING